MALLEELQGAFGSMSDTLLWRFDPAAPRLVQEKWLGTIAQHASVAGKHSAWNRLAPSCEDYQPVIAALNAATASLVAASTEGQVVAALGKMRSAIDETDMIVETNPCGDTPV